MKIKLLAFGIAKDILGTSRTTIALDDHASVARAKEVLLDTYPGFAKLKSLRFAVGEEYTTDDQTLKDGDEVIIIPPVSGG